MEGFTPVSSLIPLVHGVDEGWRERDGDRGNGPASRHKKTRSPKLKQDLLRFSRISYAPAS
jgi:hypothetical protein